MPITTPVQEHIERVRSGQTDPVAYAKDALAQAKAIDVEYAYFTTICDTEALRDAELAAAAAKQGEAGVLAGLLVSVKDNICVRDVESTASSRILKGYLPLFDATVIARLRAQGAIIIGKAVCDEFGFGSFDTNVGLDLRIPKHPTDKSRVTGGSSGGSAGITAAATFAHVAIAESTGGSIENPAAFCGVVGFCPTYGVVSRHGLISYANSLDKIGIIAQQAADIAPVFDVISGPDDHDATTIKAPLQHKVVRKVAIVKESMHGIDEGVRQAMEQTVALLRADGIIVEECSLPLTFKYGIPAYYIIATSEASTNLACLCGLRYGQEGITKGKGFSEYFSGVRSEHFGQEAKRRIILGTFARMAGYRDAYYLKATKVRTRIIEEYKEALAKYDALITPTMPVVAPRFDDVSKMAPVQQYLMDALTVGPNLAGVPHATIPIGESDGLPVGMMAITDHLHDKTLLSFLERIEKLRGGA